MEKNYIQFQPRDYILKNLSYEKQARDFIALYERHFKLSYEDWLTETLQNHKKMRNNTLLNLAFKIYDSKIYRFIRK